METRTKECSKCGEEKAMEEFAVDNSLKSGKQSRCRACYSEAYHEDKSYSQSYYQKNREKLIKYQLEFNRGYKREYRKRTPVRIYRLQANRMRKLLKSVGNEKSLRTVEYLGCSVEELMKYLEQQWQSGMSWDNYGYEGWHIDHIRPCNSFDLTDAEQQKICFHHTNLQPLWAEDNLRKSNKWKGCT
jgi:hypothetical protein